ncbi:hypothetical protein KDM41_01715, partial [bacterium]|nr:hypothetical protein [bacterium]
TPSPELMAEAGRRKGLPPARALLLAAIAVALFIGGTHWAARLSSLAVLPLDKRPEVLIDRAREVIAAAGYDEDVYRDPVDRAWGLITWNDVLREVGAADSTTSRWQALRERPDAASLWYRQSPEIIVPSPPNGPILVRGQVDLTNPPPTRSGEIIVVLDLAGRLRRLEVMPRRFATEGPSEPDWNVLFAAADLDTARFRPTMPRYQRFMAPDVRRAWLGTRIEQPEIELRVEAGASEGRPVLFNVATEEGLASLTTPPVRQEFGTSHLIFGVAQPLLILLIVYGAGRASNRNAAQRRIDKRGAVRFAVMVFVLFVLGEALGSHTFFTPLWADEFWPIFVGATFTGAIAFALYGAAEPMGRRIWPTMFVSSSRLFSQPRIPRRDPLIGQSILVGLIAAGVAFLIGGPLRWSVLPHLTGGPFPLAGFDADLLLGQRLALSTVFNQALLIGYFFIHIMALVLIRALVKRPVIAIVLTLAVWTLLSGPGDAKAVAFGLVNSAISLAVLLRWGFVAMMLQRIVLGWAWAARPVDLDSWYSQGSLIVVAAVILLALYGAWAAVGDSESRRPDGA